MRKVSLVLLGAVLGASTVTLGTQTRFLSSGVASAAASDTYRSLNLFGDVFEKIRSDYVEKPDDQKLAEAAINGMLTSLDPHSSYMDAKSFRDMQVQTRGEFGGLGIEVTQDDNAIKVVTPIDDTPASKAGILSGDIIAAIDGENVQGLTLNQAVDKMRGAVNTPVTLKILRGSKKDALDIKLTRAVITIKSVRNKIEGGDIGYIRITQFNEQTFDGVKEAIEKFNKDVPADKFKGYIVDLRNNPGGLLDQSIAVSNAFLDHGEIVSTRGRNADETQRYNARPGDLSKGRPLVVLINGGSASASEIVAGALQDHKRATIIGTRSFGKGSVQTIIPLGQNNGAVRLTTARYYTPSGRSIQAKGIEPDIQVLEDVPADLKGKDDTMGEASLKGHLTNGPEEHGSSAYVPTDPAKDTQLIAAEDLLRGVKKSASTAPAATPAAVPAATAPVVTVPATTVPPGAPAPAAPTTGGTPDTPPPAKMTK
jgi:carboxyl-terminal processing protease